MTKELFIDNVKYELLDMIQSFQPFYAEMVEDNDELFLKSYSVLDLTREDLMECVLKVLFGDQWDQWSYTEYNVDLDTFCGVVLDSWEYDESYHARFEITLHNDDGNGDELHCVYTKTTPLSVIRGGNNMTYYEYLIKKRDRLKDGLENRVSQMASWSQTYWTNVLKELDEEIENLTIEQAEKEMTW